MSGILSTVPKPVARVLLLSLPLLVTGCASVSSSLKSFTSRNTDPGDPLASLPTKPTEGYNDARKHLKDAEGTTLVFASLKEENKEYEQARVAYTNILSANPDCVAARNGIARVEHQTGRVDQAVEILEATTRKYPDDPTAWFELGSIQADRSDWPQAIDSFRLALERTSDDQLVKSTRYQLGIALARNNQIAEARDHLQFAVGESAAMFNIGFVLNEAGQSYEAQQWLRRALNSHPDERTRLAASAMLSKLSGNTAIADTQPRQPSLVNQTSVEEVSIRPQVAPEGGVAWQQQSGMPVSQSQQLPTEHAFNSAGVAVQPATMSRTPGVAQASGQRIPNWNVGQQSHSVNVNPATQTTIQPRQWTPGQ